jgi:molybdate transport system permease protein
VSRVFAVGLWVALALALTFLTLPLVALFLRVSPGELVAQLASEPAREALVVSAKTSLVAHVLILVLGTPAAYLLATRRFRGRSIVVSVLELPLVLPPAVAGIGLLAAFGSRGLLGDELETLGLRIAFTQVAVVLAVCFVASPFYLRAAITAFESVDVRLLDASRTLGAGAARTFRRVALPLALGGLGAGSTLAFARGLGEFGATIMFAGNVEGRTQTLPLVVYGEFQGGNLDASIAAAAILVVAAFGVLVAVRVLGWGRMLDDRRIA